MDTQDRKILNILQREGRRSYSEIGRAVGLSITAVKDRIDKLSTSGALKNYSAAIDERAVGYSVLAFIQVGIDEPEECVRFVEVIKDIPQVQECHHITGAFNYMLKVLAVDMASLERMLSEEIKIPGVVSRTETMIVFSSLKNDSFVECMVEVD